MRKVGDLKSGMEIRVDIGPEAHIPRWPDDLRRYQVITY
jgi:hypothetical protein